jgi:uncharacterized membrane protein YdfJ with MMPL/SSD domain
MRHEISTTWTQATAHDPSFRQSAHVMKFSRRAALIVFIVALLAILAVGFFRATMHEDLRPEPAPATSAPQP